MKVRWNCKKCNKRYKVLGKNRMCFFCDADGWYVKFARKIK